MHEGRPVYLKDIAAVIDGPEEAHSYSRIGFSNQYRNTDDAPKGAAEFPTVTLALAKKKGTNAVDVKNILDRLEILKKKVIPDGVNVEVTRHSGETAARKVDDLLESLVFAIITFVALIAFTMGWKEALVVAV